VPRIDDPPVRTTLDPEQKACHDWHIEHRGSVRGPFTVLVHDPTIADLLWQLGSTILTASAGGPLSQADIELATLTTARTREIPYMYVAHLPLAIDAGVTTEAIEVVRSQGPTVDLAPRESVIVNLARAVASTCHASDDLFNRATDVLGRPATIRLTAVVGSMLMSSSLLGVFEVEPHGPTGW
jgi:4-carboxymuconolactone decarboxylase